MTRLEALTNLKEAVEVGVWNVISDEPLAESGLRGYTLTIDEIMIEGDLNAAHALHRAVLPDCRVHDFSQYEKGWSIVLNGDTPPHFFYGNNRCPARAWLLAILSALISKEVEG